MSSSENTDVDVLLARQELIQDVIDRLLSNPEYKTKLLALNKEYPPLKDYNRRLEKSRDESVPEGQKPLMDNQLMIKHLFSILSKERIPISNEKEAQAHIANTLTSAEIKYERERAINPGDIPDFFIDGIAIEVKIKGNAMAIFKQCERYCKSEQVKQLILITNRSMGFPEKINGKSCYVLITGKAWL